MRLINGRIQAQSKGINLDLTPDGFYQVRVDYEWCTNLAHDCDMNNSDVDETVEEENQYLREKPIIAQEPNENDQ